MQLVDLQDGTPLEVANHVAAKVKQHARPWRAIIAFVLAVGAAVVSVTQREGRTRVGLKEVFEHGPVTPRVLWASATIAFVVFAAVTIVEVASKTRDFLAPRAGTGHAAVVRYFVMLIGGVVTFVVILGLLRVPITQLLVGGAVTTIFVGIAAQQSLGNVFAGIVLLFSRPFAVGDAVLLRSGALNGPIQGVVAEIGITYVRLDTGDGVMYLPNSQVLAAGVGHIRPAGLPPPSPNPTDGGRAGANSGAPSGDAPGSGGRPLSPPGL